MATYFDGDALYGTLTPRKAGTALVHDVVKVTSPDDTGRLVGKIVERDGVMFARDLSACGEPLVLAPGMFRTLTNMLRFASGHLFDSDEGAYCETVQY